MSTETENKTIENSVVVSYGSKIQIHARTIDALTKVLLESEKLDRRWMKVADLLINDGLTIKAVSFIPSDDLQSIKLGLILPSLTDAERAVLGKTIALCDENDKKARKGAQQKISNRWGQIQNHLKRRAAELEGLKVEVKESPKPEEQAPTEPTGEAVVEELPPAPNPGKKGGKESPKPEQPQSEKGATNDKGIGNPSALFMGIKKDLGAMVEEITVLNGSLQQGRLGELLAILIKTFKEVSALNPKFPE